MHSQLLSFFFFIWIIATFGENDIWEDEAEKVGQVCEVIKSPKTICKEINPNTCFPFWTKQEMYAHPLGCKKKVSMRKKACKRYFCRKKVNTKYRFFF